MDVERREVGGNRRAAIPLPPGDHLTETIQPDQPIPKPRARRPRVSPRRSTIVGHPDQGRIERDLALGRPLQRIAKKYGISKDAAWRHKRHLPPQLKAALAGHALAPGQDLEKIRVTESEGLLANLAAQRARLLLAQDEAMEAEQFGLVGQLAGGIHRNLELVGKYLGEFAAHSIHTTISLLVTPEYLELRSALLRALGPHPEAKRAVATVLHGIETTAAQRPRQPVIDVTPGGAHVGA
jgi:hypothetical protein